MNLLSRAEISCPLSVLERVGIMEGFFKKICENFVGTLENVRNREESVLERYPYRENRLYSFLPLIIIWKVDHRSKFSNLSSKLKNLLRWSFFTFIYNSSSKMNYFIYTSHHFTPHGRYELNKLTSLPMCGFIAQLVEQRTGNREVTGSNPVEALIFFSGFFFPLLKLENLLRWSLFTFKCNFLTNKLKYGLIYTEYRKIPKMSLSMYKPLQI